MSIIGVVGAIGSGKSFTQLKVGLEYANERRKQLVCNFLIDRKALLEYASQPAFIFQWHGYLYLEFVKLMYAFYWYLWRLKIIKKRPKFPKFKPHLPWIVYLCKMNKGIIQIPNKWQWRITQIEKSVGAYYSKYVGKEINNLSVKDKDYVYFPSRWWGCSQSIRKLIYDCRSDFVMSNLDSDLAGAYYQCILDDLPMDAIVKKYYYDYNIYNSDTGQLLGSGHELIIYFPSDLWQSSLNNFLKERFDFYRYCNILVERARLQFKRINEVPKVFRGCLDGIVKYY